MHVKTLERVWVKHSALAPIEIATVDLDVFRLVGLERFLVLKRLERLELVQLITVIVENLLLCLLLVLRRRLRLLLRHLLEHSQFVLLTWLVLLEVLLVLLLSKGQSFDFTLQLVDQLLHVVFFRSQPLGGLLTLSAVCLVLIFLVFESFKCLRLLCQ